ncbi:GTP pyrophosphokinase [Thalassospira indica]|uniref:RelA/SpoT domain-containing protein n=1 Tax=Thalassospira indica TaxID=1891279 RepID=A0ABN5NIZ2_9PROT|nr:RelA/SpoT domain-containing protein [Thalassospira indica]AXO15219.1 hypothetical protein DY252_14005 [Thalassospira indica]OAZ08677.1 hypothetical protein TH15_21110 [Thalassospira profundimaris]
MSDKIEKEYAERFEQALNPIAADLENFLNEILAGVPRIDRVSARAKTVERFVAKADKKLDSGEPKYTDPINQIQDQIGARVVAFYKADLDTVSDRLNEYLRPIETQEVFPESEWEFGYFGRHYIFLLPKDVIPIGSRKEIIPRCFEMQVKTLFQHAWSEANHDLGYKMIEHTLEADDKRRLAYTSAQAWGADHAFNELFLKTAD